MKPSNIVLLGSLPMGIALPWSTTESLVRGPRIETHTEIDPLNTTVLVARKEHHSDKDQADNKTADAGAERHIIPPVKHHKLKDLIYNMLHSENDQRPKLPPNCTEDTLRQRYPNTRVNETIIHVTTKHHHKTDITPYLDSCERELAYAQELHNKKNKGIIGLLTMGLFNAPWAWPFLANPLNDVANHIKEKHRAEHPKKHHHD